MKILLIEDDIQINKNLTANLKSEGYLVDSVTDGEEGLQAARQGMYDVIILDHMLPNRDGLDICTQLRQEGVTSHIIGLSVKSETINKVRFLDAGADDYVTKPFSFSELTARIRALLRRPSNIMSDLLTVDDIVMDTNQHTVKRKDVEIYLTRKEFSLFEYLLRNQGAVLSRGMILEHVWDMNADPFSNTIETHIMTLRRKLETEKGEKLIKNIPGIGYKIE